MRRWLLARRCWGPAELVERADQGAEEVRQILLVRLLGLVGRLAASAASRSAASSVADVSASSSSSPSRSTMRLFEAQSPRRRSWSSSGLLMVRVAEDRGVECGRRHEAAQGPTLSEVRQNRDRLPAVAISLARAVLDVAVRKRFGALPRQMMRRALVLLCAPPYSATTCLKCAALRLAAPSPKSSWA